MVPPPLSMISACGGGKERVHAVDAWRYGSSLSACWLTGRAPFRRCVGGTEGECRRSAGQRCWRECRYRATRRDGPEGLIEINSLVVRSCSWVVSWMLPWSFRSERRQDGRRRTPERALARRASSSSTSKRASTSPSAPTYASAPSPSSPGVDGPWSFVTRQRPRRQCSGVRGGPRS
jgi:hypothetical protein